MRFYHHCLYLFSTAAFAKRLAVLDFTSVNADEVVLKLMAEIVRNTAANQIRPSGVTVMDQANMLSLLRTRARTAASPVKVKSIWGTILDIATFIFFTLNDAAGNDHILEIDINFKSSFANIHYASQSISNQIQMARVPVSSNCLIIVSHLLYQFWSSFASPFSHQ